MPPPRTGLVSAADVMAGWPALVDRLGQRSSAFVDAADQCMHKAGLSDAPAACWRYLNLCCALGPAFEDRADNEWALAILADERLMPEVKLHRPAPAAACAGPA